MTRIPPLSRRWWISLAGFWALSMLSSQLMAASEAAERPQSDVTFQLSNGRLSIEAENVSRRELLEKIGESDALTVEIRGEIDSADTLSASVRNQPIREAVIWLVGNHSYAFIDYGGSDDEPSPEATLIIFDPDRSGAAVPPPIVSDAADNRDNNTRSIADALASGDQEERLVAVAKAKLLPSDEAVALLETAIEQEHDRKTSSRAVAALLRLRSPQAESLLRKVAMESGDHALRIQAINALSFMLGAGSVDLLDDILTQETRHRIRLAALASLQRVDSDGARILIEFALDDSDARIRAAAKRALDGKDVIPKRRRRF